VTTPPQPERQPLDAARGPAEQSAYAAQLDFLDAMNQLGLAITSGDVTRSAHGTCGVRLGVMEVEALTQLAEILNKVALDRRIVAVLVASGAIADSHPADRGGRFGGHSGRGEFLGIPGAGQREEQERQGK
jgi:hypothetical protein